MEIWREISTYGIEGPRVARVTSQDRTVYYPNLLSAVVHRSGKEIIIWYQLESKAVSTQRFDLCRIQELEFLDPKNMRHDDYTLPFDLPTPIVALYDLTAQS